MTQLLRNPALASVLIVVVMGCASSQSKVPHEAANLPRFDFSTLKGTELALRVVDRRAEATESAGWMSRLTADLSVALSREGVAIAKPASATLEVRLLHARSDFESQQWKGCVGLAARLSPVPSRRRTIAAFSDRCVTQSGLGAPATASQVRARAYQDSLAELLSKLDQELGRAATRVPPPTLSPR